jgi:protein ImuB
VSAAARLAGVTRGMTLSAARALSDTLEVRPWDDRVIARAVTMLTGRLVDLSPQVTAAAGAPGVWWIGAGGFERLGGERALLRRLLALARKYHPRSRVASADTCIAAHVATMLRWPGNRAAHLVPPGGSARLLRRAPLTLIPMDEDLRATLAALGIVTAGALAALPAGEIEHRWGDEGLRAWRLARGDDDRRPVLAAIAAAAAVTVELPDPVTTLEPVLFLLTAALERLVRDAARAGDAIAAVVLTLVLDRAPPHDLLVALARPVARAAPLVDQCRAALEGCALEAPIRALAITVREAVPLPDEQGDLLRPAWKDPAAMEGVFARLRAGLGQETVVRPLPVDRGHRPADRAIWADRPADAGQGTPRVSDAVARLLTPPAPVAVRRRRGKPALIRWEGRRWVVTRATGPEHLAGRWWDQPYDREYWYCDTARGPLLLSHARGTERWWVEGWGD